MSEKYEAANLILKLYELRREEVMRKARQWYIAEFNPENTQDIASVTTGDNSAYYRMVTTYWDMACSFVTNGAIDAQMFNDANMEHVAVYSKIEPFIAEIRTVSNMPHYMQHLEKVVTGMPNAQERMTVLREQLKRMSAARAETAKTT
ncbi:MAG TPA: hypothetical protein VF528_19180 [Pyrinomonadaceae bacterium]|jgi:hypothetical protein